MIFLRTGPGSRVFRLAAPASTNWVVLLGLYIWQHGIVVQKDAGVTGTHPTDVRADRGIAVVSDRRVRVMHIRVTDAPRRAHGAVEPKDVRGIVMPIIVVRAAGGPAAGSDQVVQVTRHQIDNAGGI